MTTIMAMMSLRINTICAISFLLVSYIVPSFCDFPFRNVSLPFGERVNDLVSRLTLQEIVDVMSRGGGGGDGRPALPIERLGISPYVWATECIHGNAKDQATAFPQSIGLAATFNPSLMKQVAGAIGAEVRAMHMDFMKKGDYSLHTGLNCFSPVINIMRHPLWGRNQETYGEDPYLTGTMAREFVKGLKGDNERYYQANAVCKHFDAYGGPEDLPESRMTFNAKVSERDLFTTYLPQFKECIDSGALGVMCSYNSVNGIPACASKMLLTDVLRTLWNFTGFVVSDSGAIEFAILNHRYFHSIIDAAVGCAEAGTNLELHAGQYARGVYDWLGTAVKDGRISESLLRERTKPLFYTRMRLGEFDPPDMNPFNFINMSVVQSRKHTDLAILAAQESFVLLKNDGLLPITGAKTIAVVGPFANNAEQQLGNYGPDIAPEYTTTVYDGIRALGNTKLAPGCNDTHCLHYDDKSVKDAVRDADFVVVCLGTGSEIATENFDRENMLLPGYQSQLLKDAKEYAHGKVLLLLFSAGPLDIRAAVQDPAISAIIHCFYPAQSTGTALFSTLLMHDARSNPAGRLPFTWYASDEQVPSMVDYDMKNRTYRYFEGLPLFPFGFGLSYTTFQYSDLDLQPARVKAGNNVKVNFNLKNTGPVAGSEVNQVYISWRNATVPTPKYQLVNFNRTMVDKGQTVSRSIEISSDQMAVYVDGKGFIIEPGEIMVYVGGCSPGSPKSPSNMLKGMFTIY